MVRDAPSSLRALAGRWDDFILPLAVSQRALSKRIQSPV